MRFGLLKWCLVVACLSKAAAAEETAVEIGVLPGLRFDKVRFVVKPGATVKLTLNNPDQMIHNWVLTEPGARLEIVNAAMLLGGDAPAKHYLPDSRKILAATKALNPGASETLTFTAPTKEDVYPYVCTFIGHGFIMYGAMYVTHKPESELPPLDKDPNVPPPLPMVADHAHHQPLTTPKVQRTFMPDCGPAAIAVGLPGGQSYCWDAGACRLRYVWKGGFIDPTPHLLGKGEEFARIIGRVYYRADAGFPLRLGDPGRLPEVKFQGYQLVEGHPQFLYQIDGLEVRELTRPAPQGGALLIRFDIPSIAGDLHYVSDPRAGASFSSSAGQWSGGVLKLSAAEARSFQITLTEKPGHEPIGYWSMNDTISGSKDAPPPGAVGRAFAPGSGKSPKPLDTGLSTSELRNGGTIALWFQMKDPGAKDQYLLTAGQNVKDCLALGLNLDGPGVGFVSVSPKGAGKLTQSVPLDGQWRHLAVVFDARQTAIHLDGRKTASSAATPWVHTDANLTIGSLGKERFFKGLIDEVRVWSRVLAESEIMELYRREKAASGQVR